MCCRVGDQQTCSRNLREKTMLANMKHWFSARSTDNCAISRLPTLQHAARKSSHQTMLEGVTRTTGHLFRLSTRQSLRAANASCKQSACSVWQARNTSKPGAWWTRCLQRSFALPHCVSRTMSSASDAAVHGSGAGAGAWAGAGAGAGASSARDKPVLIIHVDANETVLFTDEAGGKTQHNIVSEVVAGRAWGKLVLQGDAALADPSVDGSNMLKWELITTELSDAPPAGYSASDIGKTAGKIILYREYVRKVLYPRIKMTSLEGSELHAALRENNRRKRVWIETFTSFLDKGQAGETLASHRDAAVEALVRDGQVRCRMLRPRYLTTSCCMCQRIPADKVDACAAALDELADGYRFLCPAYFNLLLHLRDTGRDYAMTFRTFGTDSARLVDEHNLFCEGRHPLYPGVFMDGTRTCGVACGHMRGAPVP